MVYSHTVTYGAALGRYDIASNARAFDPIQKKKKKQLKKCMNALTVQNQSVKSETKFECTKMFFKLRFN